MSALQSEIGLTALANHRMQQYLREAENDRRASEMHRGKGSSLPKTRRPGLLQRWLTMFGERARTLSAGSVREQPVG